MTDTDQYHVHLTIPTLLSIPKGWKETGMILINGTYYQKDIMITKHYKIGYHKINSIQDIKIDSEKTAKKLNASRIKIEKDNNFPEYLNNYLECHVKTTEVFDNTWRRSKNPIDTSETFWWTKRFYSGKTCDIITNTKKYLNNFKTLEIKFEELILDTNQYHDNNWINSNEK